MIRQRRFVLYFPPKPSPPIQIQTVEPERTGPDLYGRERYPSRCDYLQGCTVIHAPLALWRACCSVSYFLPLKSNEANQISATGPALAKTCDRHLPFFLRSGQRAGTRGPCPDLLE